jgi:hypothetical protein
VPLSSQRLARNQVLFREVNARLHDVADDDPDGKAKYLCECGDVSCTEKVELTLYEYEAVRARPKCFFIVLGHQRPGVERVVDQSARYTVVEKIAPPDKERDPSGAESASATRWNPRSWRPNRSRGI